VWIATIIVSSLILHGSAYQAPPVTGPPTPLPGTPVPLPEAPSLIAWSVELPDAPIVSPLITADAVIVAYRPGIIAAFHRDDGRAVWRAELQPDAALAADGPLLYVSAGDTVHALRLADGSLAWQVRAGTLAAPMVAQDGWLLTQDGAALSARRAADGTAVWTIEASAQDEASVISGDMIVSPLLNGRVEARDLLSGRLRWGRQLGGAPGPLAVIGDHVFVGASNRIFYSLDALTGRVDWPMRVGATVRGRATADADRVFFTALDNLVRAVDRWHGAVRWQTPVAFRPLTGALSSGGRVFVAGPDEGVRILDAATGAPVGRIAFPGRLVLAPAFADTGGAAVFAALTGTLEETWKLSLTWPLRAATAPAPR